MTRILALIVVLGFATLGAQVDKPVRINPVDEGLSDPSFRYFRDQLLAAVRAGSVREVLAFTTADIQVSRDGRRRGTSALRQIWDLDRTPSKFLRELEVVLQHGGRFTESGTFVAPYAWTEFPESLSPPDYVVVIDGPSPIMTGAGSVPQIATASTGDLLRFRFGDKDWLNVRTGDGRWGYIKRSAVRRPNSFRAYFTKIMEEWKLVGFFEGVD